MKRLAITAVATGLLLTGLLSACSTGPVRRVSEPTANIQQLTVRADGQWSVDLRIDNFSSVPMRFDAASLALTIGGESAGTLSANPGLTIGPESADVATLTLAPSSAARITVADALSNRRELAYTLKGTLDAGPEGGKSRQYRIDRSSALNPAPGLPGVLR